MKQQKQQVLARQDPLAHVLHMVVVDTDIAQLAPQSASCCAECAASEHADGAANDADQTAVEAT